ATGRPEQRHELPALDREVETGDRDVRPERLGEPLDDEKGHEAYPSPEGGGCRRAQRGDGWGRISTSVELPPPPPGSLRPPPPPASRGRDKGRSPLHLAVPAFVPIGAFLVDRVPVDHNQLFGALADRCHAGGLGRHLRTPIDRPVAVFLGEDFLEL